MKYIDADRIRAEIDRLYGEYKAKFHQNGDSYHLGIIDGLDMAERILDTLPDEPVTDCHDLTEAAEKSARQYYVDGGYSPFPNTETASHIAGFKAGAEWMKKQIPVPEDTVIFQKGVEEGKRLMMEGAVEGDYDCQYMTPAVFLDKYLDGIKDGDKVKIIIVKEEEQ